MYDKRYGYEIIISRQKIFILLTRVRGRSDCRQRFQRTPPSFLKKCEEQEFVRINGFESRWSDFSSDTGNLSWVASTTFDKGKEVKMIGRARILLTSE